MKDEESYTPENRRLKAFEKALGEDLLSGKAANVLSGDLDRTKTHESKTSKDGAKDGKDGKEGEDSKSKKSVKSAVTGHSGGKESTVGGTEDGDPAELTGAARFAAGGVIATGLESTVTEESDAGELKIQSKVSRLFF